MARASQRIFRDKCCMRGNWGSNILAAVNEAVRSSQALMESKLGGLAGGALGGLGLPGLGE